MKKIVTILLAVMIVAQVAHQGLIYGYYVLNKEYITDYFCENKDTPELKCNGKCHLKDLLSINKIETAPEQPSLPNLEEIKVPLLYFQAIETTSIYNVFFRMPLSMASNSFSYLFDYKYIVTSLIFHPPQL